MQRIRRFLNSKAFSEIRISAVFRLNVVFRRRNPQKSIHSWLRASNRRRELHLHSFLRTMLTVLHGEREISPHTCASCVSSHKTSTEQLRRLCGRERAGGLRKKKEEEKKREGGGALAVESGRESAANVQPKHTNSRQINTLHIDGETGVCALLFLF